MGIAGKFTSHWGQLAHVSTANLWQDLKRFDIPSRQGSMRNPRDLWGLEPNDGLGQCHAPSAPTTKTYEMSAAHSCLPLFAHMNLKGVLWCILSSTLTHSGSCLNQHVGALKTRRVTNEYEGMITRASNNLDHCWNHFAVSRRLKFKQMPRLKPGILLPEARAGNTTRNSLAGPGNTMFDPNTWRPYLRILQNLGLVPENAEKPTILLDQSSKPHESHYFMATLGPVVWANLSVFACLFTTFTSTCQNCTAMEYCRAACQKWTSGDTCFFFDWKPTMLKTMSKGCLVVNSNGKTKTVWTMLIRQLIYQTFSSHCSLDPSLQRRLRMNSPNDSWYVSLQEDVALGHHTVELPKNSKLFYKINLCLRGGLGWWFGSLGIDVWFCELRKKQKYQTL